MTHCTPTPIQFSSLNRKKIQANFSGGAITCDAGLLLLREVDKQLGLTQALSQVIRDERHAGYVDHSVEQMLKQRVYGLAAGYEDVTDHDTLREDLTFQIAVGKEAPLASSATLSRFENSVDRASLVAMSQVLVEHFITRQTHAPKELLLDFDPTDNEIYGQQEQRAYHGYYKHYCFLPLHVFCGDDLLVSLLRPSNIDGAKYAGAILRLLVKRFRQAWPNVKIVFRGDCAFSRTKILHWCEHNDVKYVTGISGNQRLQRLAQPLVDKAQAGYEREQTKQRLFSEFQYAAKSWKTSRRIIVKAEHHNKGTNIRFLVTNMDDTPQTLYDSRYCPRGDMENGIKQLKLDLHSDRNSCTDFFANQCRLLWSSIAYVLMTELQKNYLKKTAFEKSYCKTIRLKLFKIGAVIVKNTRRIQLFLSSAYPYQHEFIMITQRLVPT